MEDAGRRGHVHKLRLPYATTRIIIIAWIVPLFILAGIQAIPVFSGSDAQYINQAGLQRTRAQFFAQAVLTLEYRPLADRAQTINDLQAAYSLFQREQAILLANNQPDIQLALQTARPDYLALVAAIEAVLSHTSQSIDPTQVDIILAHGRAYASTMNNVIMLLQQYANERIQELFAIEIIIEFLLITNIILILFKYKPLLTKSSQESR